MVFVKIQNDEIQNLKFQNVFLLCDRRHNNNDADNDSGSLHYHLIVGTTSNSIVDVVFNIKPKTGGTEILDFDVEPLVQGRKNERSKTFLQCF